MPSFTMTGRAAEMRWVYHPAATLGPWTMTTIGHRLQVTAEVVSADPHRVAQRPLAFVVQRPRATWTWTVETLEIAGATLTAWLVPQEGQI